MIVNSQACLQASSKQSYLGLEGQDLDSSFNQFESRMQREATMSQQQVGRFSNSSKNALYEPAASRHMLDLANLQPINGQQIPMSQSHTMDQLGSQQVEAFQQSVQATRSQTITAKQRTVANQQQQQHDLALYSPSSSTSLLYHIYDQINLPNEHQMHPDQFHHQQQQRLPVDSKKTTILNPASLFSNQLPAAPAIPSQMQQQNYPTNYHLPQQQQQLFPASTLHHHQPPNYYHLATSHQQQQQQMLTSRHASGTFGRRPLSTSGASLSSSNGNYTRQSRHTSSGSSSSNGKQLPNNPLQAHNTNLASILQANQHVLDQLSSQHQQHQLYSNGHQQPQLTSAASLAASLNNLSKPSHLFSGGIANPGGQNPFNLVRNCQMRKFNKQIRHFYHNYQNLIKFSLCLIIFGLLLVPLTSLLLSKSRQTASSSQPALVSSNQLQQASSNPKKPFQFQLNLGPVSGTNLDTPRKQFELYEEPASTQAGDSSGSQQQQEQNLLASRLLVGEFVVSSQNYSHSAAQRSMLASQIVKLLDQVFLATNVRHLYLRTEVTNISSRGGFSGIVVEFNILLSESIAYAAQQFGNALYDSLIRSHERLAGLSSFLIDKSSIKFNTVTDKDLKSGIVPASLIAPSIARELGLDSPPSGELLPTSLATTDKLEPDTSGSSIGDAVVWTEWSQWSSCVDKNGLCDPSRLHSRLRKCVSQLTGEHVDASSCKLKFSSQDRELEVDNCALSCQSSQQQQPQQQQDQSPSSLLSDAPHTAPSVLLGGQELGTFSSSFGAPPAAYVSLPKLAMSKQQQEIATSESNLQDLLTGSSSSVAPLTASSTQTSSPTELMQHQPSPLPSGIEQATQLPSTIAHHLRMLNAVGRQGQLSCANCTSDEICLLLADQKVPFCAKQRDRNDASGCGGWCEPKAQICQAVGPNTFKCLHDSECLPEEWRCHNSACIPLSARCDGHYNCYDNSDERNCPAAQVAPSSQLATGLSSSSNNNNAN